MMGLDVNDAGFIRILMQSAGGWYFDKDGNLSIEGNPALKAALETEQKILQAGIYKPAAGWTEWVSAFTSGDAATVTTGVWITGTVKAQADQSGKWGVAPIPKLNVEGATHASNLGGSSWYVMESSAEKDEAIDFLNEIYAKDSDFYQKILVDQGAVGSLLSARSGPAYSKTDDFFGGEPVWQNFSDWLAKVPSVNYGIFTNEVDTAVTAHLPDLAKGANVDDVLKAIQSQAEGQIQ
jgi:lactose/L-arabinose transport system substrate-binding protein